VNCMQREYLRNILGNPVSLKVHFSDSMENSATLADPSLNIFMACFFQANAF
jgi:hypothetical protein